jgi:hypothetical protein
MKRPPPTTTRTSILLKFMEWNEVKNSVWFTFQMGSHIVGQKALNYKINFQVSDLTEIICSPFRNFPFAVANPSQSGIFDRENFKIPTCFVGEDGLADAAGPHAQGGGELGGLWMAGEVLAEAALVDVVLAAHGTRVVGRPPLG